MSNKADYIAHHRGSDGAIHDLWDHLEEVARMTGEFASKVGLQKQGELIGYLHDIGKASDEFQVYIKSAVGLIDECDDDYVDAAGNKGHIDHSTAGAQLLERFFTGKDRESALVEQFLSLCLVSHHSRLGVIDCISPDGRDIFSKRMKKNDNRTHAKEVESKLCSTHAGDKKGSGVSIGIRGPVSIHSAFSVQPIDIISLQITKSVSGEGDDGKKASDTMGIKHRVDQGVYSFYGSMNPQLAEKTKFSDVDADAIKQILPKLFENDASSARPEGSMRVSKVIWWKHNCKTGQYSSARVHNTLTVNPDGTYKLNNLEGLEPEEIEGF